MNKYKISGFKNLKLEIPAFWSQLRWNLLFYFVVLAVLPLVIVVSLIIIPQASDQAREQVARQMESVAELKREQILRWLGDTHAQLSLFLADVQRRNKLIDLATTPLSDPEIDQDLNELLTEAVEAQALIEEFFFYDTKGRILAASNLADLGKVVTRQPYFNPSLTGDYIQPPYYAVGSAELTMLVTRPLNGPNGQPVGVLAGRLNLETLGQIMTEVTGLGNTGETYLVSLENNYLVTPSRFQDEGYILTQAYRSPGIDRALRGEEAWDIYPNYREPAVEVIGAYRWIPELEVGLLAEIDESEALVTFNRTITFAVILTFLVALVAASIGFYNATRISKPISTLTQVATQITAGNLNQRAEVVQRNEIGVLATAFNSMTAQLQGLIDSLEERVRERTRALETSAEISRQITTIIDVDELLKYLVHRVQQEFNFYHTHIYLVETETGDLVMTEGSGEVGQQLKAQGHRLGAGQGIVGTVATTGEAFLSNNVDEVLNFVPNPRLPNTKSELAVPLRKGKQVLGVLDIQSEQPHRFTPQDVALMQSIADQAAVALDNARLLAETQTALREVERLNRRLTRTTWEEFGQELKTAGYRFIRGAKNIIRPDSTAWLPPMKEAAVQKQLVKQSHPGNGQPPRAELAVPLVLRGEVIGVLGVKREETVDWAKEEMDAVEAVANQVARALENARLSKEQEKTIEQLKEIDRLKSEFLTSMSHELRTPLNSIIGFADVLLQGIDGDLPDLAINDIRLIHSSGQHLLALINDILDLAKIEAGGLELMREPLDVQEMVKDVLAASSSLVKNKPVEIQVDLSEQPLPPVYADKLRLSQVLINLVSNAAKFTHEGSITIKAEVRANEPDRMRIAVIDTGIGIPPDKLETIFDRFRQADQATTRKYGGTGLGLAISRNLVQMHGGDLKVLSEENVGSEFYFTIPLAETVLLEQGPATES